LLQISQAAGHKDSKTTQGYLRDASQVGGNFREVFPRLPASSLGLSLDQAISQDTPNTAESLKKTLRSQRELKNLEGSQSAGIWLDSESDGHQIATDGDGLVHSFGPEDAPSDPLHDAASELFDRASVAARSGDLTTARTLADAATRLLGAQTTSARVNDSTVVPFRGYRRS
jgi:hypothetical protein